MPDINKVLDRVRKLLALSEHTTSEAEAAEAASRATKLMDEYQLSEALVRLDEPNRPAEPILQNEKLEPDAKTNTKRVAWKETIASAVARDLGVKMYYWTSHKDGRNRTKIHGMGRESAVQTWRYTCQYLWRAVDDLAVEAWDGGQDAAAQASARAWKNAFRVGCASRLAVRISEKRSEAETLRAEAKKAAVGDRHDLALAVVEKDRDAVDQEYAEMSKTWKGTLSSVGQVSSSNGYQAGKRAGDQVSLGGGRSGLAAGQGRLT